MKTTYYTSFGKASIRLLGVLCIGFLVFLSSCEKDSEGSTSFALKDNPSDVAVSPEGMSQTFTVQTSGAWKVKPLSTERWLKIEPAEGVGEGTFTVTVARNTSVEPRSSILTFEVNGRVQNKVLTIEQEAGTQNTGEDDIYVNLDGMSSLEVPEEGMNARFTVRSTGEWRAEIIEGDDWFSMSLTEGQYDTGVDISVSPNLEVDPRTARVVFYLDGERVAGEFEVIQEGVILILFEDFNWLTYGNTVFNTTTGERRYDLWTPTEKAMGWYSTPVETVNASGNIVVEQLAYSRPGFIKLGKTSWGGDLISPKLEAIEGTRNLRVTFKAANYMTAGGNVDHNHLLINVIGPGTVSVSDIFVNNPPDYANDPHCVEVWRKPEAIHTFTITGATAETQVRFMGGAYDMRPDISDWPRNVNRIFLDDILITVIKQ